MTERSVGAWDLNGWEVEAEGRDYKVHEETFESDGYVLYFDCGKDFISVYVCQNCLKLDSLYRYSLYNYTSI